ncbi:MAG: HigA family addiction module antidote protein [Halieaceae bacterium]|nr:HigA family addiction module antidote protein [Halieaceae bacterium]
MSTKTKPSGHPGIFVKQHVIPAGLSVTDAAKQLGLGRPALSNFLNGKASLSPEMATRLEKAFGADRKKLLDMQAAFSGEKQVSSDQPAVVRGYVPSVLEIKAGRIDEWAADNITARNELAALLRRLVNSTSADIRAVDFPAFDNAERPGWDGTIDAASPTPWIPADKSGWEFGCNKDPQAKANKDYAARTGSVPEDERANTIFVFVTPRNWTGKKDWVEGKKKESQWKDVRAYDASDLEQWLEVSAPAQIWLAERINMPVTGYRSLSRCWDDWVAASEPILSAALFDPAIKSFRNTFSSWLNSEASRPFVIAADSRDEALAFLSCMMAAPELQGARDGDDAIVFESPEALSKLASASDGAFVAVAAAPKVERALAGFYRRFHCVIVRPRNLVDSEPDIVLDLLNSTDFEAALKEMGIDEENARRLDRESGRSPTILRRRLSRIDAIKQPHWAEDQAIAGDLVPAALVGTWNADTDADRQIISLLASSEYDMVEERIAQIRRTEDAPLWSIGKYRGVASKIDALFAIAPAITKPQLDNFFVAAEYVLSEADPALELPEDKRPYAALYDKVRDHSSVLRNGICETLVLLAVHGNSLFFERLGIDVEARVAILICKLLTPLSAEGMHSNNHDLPNYAEAAPEEFLNLVEEDLRSSDPVVFQLLKPADSSLFGGGCPRTGLLWALECLVWKPEHLLRVTKILATLSTRKIDDNWANKPEETLKSIFRSWMPQTSALVEQRIKAVEYIAKHQPELAWDLCAEQFEGGSRIGHYNYRPRWRGDASGAGQPVTRGENFKFVRKAVDICLDWPTHDERTLGDLVERLQLLSEEDQVRVWGLIDAWAKTEPGEAAKAALRERIRRYAFTRRSRQKNISKTSAERARTASDLLAPHDPVIRHKWLFESQWVQESYEELENVDLDYKNREKRVITQRTTALKEIWNAQGFEGIRELLKSSGANRVIGSIMVDLLKKRSQRTSFIKTCLLEAKGDIKPAIQDCLWGVLLTVDDAFLPGLIAEIGGDLTEDQLIMLFLCMPFRGVTWRLLVDQSEQIRVGYWKNVNAHWNDLAPDEINEVIDRLLEVQRPVAAFHAVHLSWKNVKTARLTKLLHAVATTPKETPETFRLAEHGVSDAFEALDKRNEVGVQEKANLEFMYLEALDHGKHGIPNLEKQIAVSPELYVQAIGVSFKRSDDGKDPEEWLIADAEKHEHVATGTYRLLDRLRRTPGTDEEDGVVKINDLKEWLSKVRDLCKQHGRADICDQMIGQLLSRSQPDEDGNWPSHPICEALEWMSSEHVGRGFHVGTRNSRGVHSRGEGGDQERDLANKYRAGAQHVGFEFPYVGRLLESIAESYDREAQWEDTDAKVRSRIPY